MVAVGVRPAPVLPVTATTESRGSTSPSFSSGTAASSVAVTKQPGWPTCPAGVAARCSGSAHRNSGEPPRSAVSMPVDRLVGRSVREAEIRRDVHHLQFGPRPPGRGQRLVEQGRRGAVRRGAEQRDRLGLPHQPRQILAPRERQPRVAPREVREGGLHPAAALAVREHGRRGEARMAGEEPQQLPGDIARPPQHDRGHRRRSSRDRLAQERRSPAVPSPAPPAARRPCGR